MEREDRYTRASSIMSALHGQRKNEEAKKLNENYTFDMKNVAMNLAAKGVNNVRVKGDTLSNSRTGLSFDHTVMAGGFIWGWGFEVDEVFDPEEVTFTFVLQGSMGHMPQPEIVKQFKTIAEKYLKGITQIKFRNDSVRCDRFVVKNKDAFRKIIDFIAEADRWLESPERFKKESVSKNESNTLVVEDEQTINEMTPTHFARIIHSIWDNGGETADRYTIVLKGGDALGLSDNPDHPQGFSQWDHGVKPGSHLGKKINFNQLPKKVQDHALDQLSFALESKELSEDPSKED